MSKWYGAGFVIFLARLIVAILLAVIDFLLVTIFFFAGLFYMFNETVRNIYYGLLVIIILLMLASGRFRSWVSWRCQFFRGWGHNYW